MSSKDSSRTSRAARWYGLAGACLIAVILAGVLVYFYFPTRSSNPSASVSPSPTLTPMPASPSADPFRQFDQEVASLVERQAIWQAPKRLDVNRTARLGLVIGDISALRTQIRELVPGNYPQPAGQVKVGSTIGVQLEADPGDASVTPKDAINKSTGEHTALLWTWFVRGTHPNPELFLKAHIVVKTSNGHVLSTELPLSIPVGRTWQYTVGQIFTNWATWLSIAGVLSGAVLWIWRKRRRQPHASSHQHKPLPRSRMHVGRGQRRH